MFDHGVDHLDPVQLAAGLDLGERGLEGVEPHPAVVDRHPDDAGPAGFQRPEEDEIRRRLGQDDVAGVEQGFGHEVEQLRRSGRHHDPRGDPGERPRLDPLVPLQEGDDLAAERRVADGGPVLECPAPFDRVGEDLGGDPGHGLDGEARLVDEAGGQRDQARVGQRRLHELADDRRLGPAGGRAQGRDRWHGGLRDPMVRWSGRRYSSSVPTSVKADPIILGLRSTRRGLQRAAGPGSIRRTTCRSVRNGFHSSLPNGSFVPATQARRIAEVGSAS